MGRFSNVQQFLLGARSDPSSKPPYLLPFRSSTLLIVVTVNLAVFTDIFYYGLVVPVIPFALSGQVGIPEDQVQQWVSVLLAAYSAALFIGSPIAGLYADHSSSRRWPLLIGLLALAASTFLLAFGNSIGLFILGRALQGLSAAVVWTVGCALLVDTMGSSVGVAMGYVNISMSIGLLLSPVIGGAVYNTAGYRAVYYVAFGIVGLDVVLRLVVIEKKVARQWAEEGITYPETDNSRRDIEKAGSTTDIDPEGIGHDVDMSQAPDTAIDFIVEAHDHKGLKSPGCNDEHTPSSGQSTQKRYPIIVLLKSPRLLAALYGIVVESGILIGFDAVLALFVERVFGWNSTAVGILLLALFIPGFIAPLAGWLADKYGAKWPSFVGFIATTPILVSLQFVTENTLQHKILLAVLLALAGFTLPFSMTPLMAEISYVIEAKEAKSPGIFGEKGVYGLAYGLFNTAFALGGIVGPIWAGYVVESAGWGTLAWTFGLWSASAAAVVFFWLGGQDKKPATSVAEETLG
ncbi:MFS transporter-like protein [Xylariaceae sp. FL1651]|nr:MFS transporter-like protein [Xylariaceae sp. FL1651]